MDDSTRCRIVSWTARGDDRRGRSDSQSSSDANSSVFARLGPKVPTSADMQPYVPPYVPMPVGEPLLAGMIFGCTTETFHECLHRQLFGLPASNKAQVLRVSPGAKLFLFNFQLKHMSGIFEATSHGGMHIVREAFGGNFAAQVKIRRIEDCPNLPVDVFSKAIKENYIDKRKFKYDLNYEQLLGPDSYGSVAYCLCYPSTCIEYLFIVLSTSIYTQYQELMKLTQMAACLLPYMMKVGRLMSLFRARAGPWFSLPREEVVQPDPSYGQRILRIPPLQHPNNIQKRTSSPNLASTWLRTSSDDCLRLATRTSYPTPLASRVQSHQSLSPIVMGSLPLLSETGDRMKNKKHSPTPLHSTSTQEELRHFSRVEQSKTAERTPQVKSKIFRATSREEEEKDLHSSTTSRSSKDRKKRQETERRRESPQKKPKLLEKRLGSPLRNVHVSSGQPTDLQMIPSLVIPVKEALAQGSSSVTVVSANLQLQGRAGLVAGHSQKATVSRLEQGTSTGTSSPIEAKLSKKLTVNTGSTESCPEMERREEGDIENEEVSDVREMVHLPLVDESGFEKLKILLEDVSTRSQDLEGTLKESNDEEERRGAGELKGESNHGSDKISTTSASGGNFEQSNLLSDVQLGQPNRCGTPKGLDCVVELEEEQNLETYISLSVERSETLAQVGPATTLVNSHNKEEVVRSVLRKRQRTEEDHAGLPSDLKVHKTGCSPTLDHDPGSAGGERLEPKGRTDGEEICDIAEGQAHSTCSGHSDVTQPSQTPDDVADSSLLVGNSGERREQKWPESLQFSSLQESMMGVELSAADRSCKMEFSSTECSKTLFDEGDIETSGTRVELQKTEGYDFNQDKVDVELHISEALFHPEGKVRNKESIMKTEVLPVISGDSESSWDREEQLEGKYRNPSASPRAKTLEGNQRQEDMLFCELGIPEGSIEYEKKKMGKESKYGHKDREERESGSMNSLPVVQPTETSPLREKVLLCELGMSEGSSALGGKRTEEDLLKDSPLKGLGHQQERLTTPSTESNLQTTNRNPDSKLDKGAFGKSVGEERGPQSANTGNEEAYGVGNTEDLLAHKGKQGAKERLRSIAATLKDQGVGQDGEARELEIVALVKKSSLVMEFGPPATDDKFQSADLGSLQELGERERDERETWMPNRKPKPQKPGISQIQEKEGACLLKSPQGSSALDCRSRPGREDKMEVIDSSAHQSDWSKHHSTDEHFLEGREEESCGTEKANEAIVDLEIIPLQGAQDGPVETVDEVMQTTYIYAEALPNCSRFHPGPEESTNEIMEISLTSAESEDDVPEVKPPVTSYSNRGTHSSKDITPWKLLQKPHQ